MFTDGEIVKIADQLYEVLYCCNEGVTLVLRKL
jgi:hypothetical protein